MKYFSIFLVIATFLMPALQVSGDIGKVRGNNKVTTNSLKYLDTGDIGADSISVPDSVYINSTHQLNFYYNVHNPYGDQMIVTFRIDTSDVTITFDTLSLKVQVSGQYMSTYSWLVGPIPKVTYNITLVAEMVGGSPYAGNDTCYAHTVSIPLGVEEQSTVNSKQLSVNAKPNPFIQSTIIKYFILTPTADFASLNNGKSKVSLALYDITGSCVKILVNEQKPAGSYSINLNAKELKTGIYFVRLSAGDYKETKKLVLMK